MLAQDYILKRLSAALMHPDNIYGRQFWQKVYRQAYEKYGTTDIPVDAFHKVWILPEKAKVFVSGKKAWVVDAHLKVMMETDHAALNQRKEIEGGTGEKEGRDKDGIAAGVMREVIVPAIETEVNTGADFAPLRQIFFSLVLAKWYKDNLKESFLSRAYTGRGNVDGLADPKTRSPEALYADYLKVFKDGIVNFIREEDDGQGGLVPRHYFAGGISGGDIRYAATSDASEIAPGETFKVRGDYAGANAGAFSPAQRKRALRKLFITHQDFVFTVDQLQAALAGLGSGDVSPGTIRSDLQSKLLLPFYSQVVRGRGDWFAPPLNDLKKAVQKGRGAEMIKQYQAMFVDWFERMGRAGLGHWTESGKVSSLRKGESPREALELFRVVANEHLGLPDVFPASLSDIRDAWRRVRSYADAPDHYPTWGGLRGEARLTWPADQRLCLGLITRWVQAMAAEGKTRYLYTNTIRSLSDPWAVDLFEKIAGFRVSRAALIYERYFQLAEKDSHLPSWGVMCRSVILRSHRRSEVSAHLAALSAQDASQAVDNAPSSARSGIYKSVKGALRPLEKLEMIARLRERLKALLESYPQGVSISELRKELSDEGFEGLPDTAFYTLFNLQEFKPVHNRVIRDGWLARLSYSPQEAARGNRFPVRGYDELKPVFVAWLAAIKNAGLEEMTRAAVINATKGGIETLPARTLFEEAVRRLLGLKGVLPEGMDQIYTAWERISSNVGPGVTHLTWDDLRAEAGLTWPKDPNAAAGVIVKWVRAITLANMKPNDIRAADLFEKISGFRVKKIPDIRKHYLVLRTRITLPMWKTLQADLGLRALPVKAREISRIADSYKNVIVAVNVPEALSEERILAGAVSADIEARLKAVSKEIRGYEQTSAQMLAHWQWLAKRNASLGDKALDLPAWDVLVSSVDQSQAGAVTERALKEFIKQVKAAVPGYSIGIKEFSGLYDLVRLLVKDLSGPSGAIAPDQFQTDMFFTENHERVFRITAPRGADLPGGLQTGLWSPDRYMPSDDVLRQRPFLADLFHLDGPLHTVFPEGNVSMRWGRADDGRSFVDVRIDPKVLAYKKFITREMYGGLNTEKVKAEILQGVPAVLYNSFSAALVRVLSGVFDEALRRDSGAAWIDRLNYRLFAAGDPFNVYLGVNPGVKDPEVVYPMSIDGLWGKLDHDLIHVPHASLRGLVSREPTQDAPVGAVDYVIRNGHGFHGRPAAALEKLILRLRNEGVIEDIGCVLLRRGGDELPAPEKVDLFSIMDIRVKGITRGSRLHFEIKLAPEHLAQWPFVLASFEELRDEGKEVFWRPDAAQGADEAHRVGDPSGINGGIDMNTSAMTLEEEGDRSPWTPPADPAQWDAAGITGLVPVIRSVTPVQDPVSFLTQR